MKIEKLGDDQVGVEGDSKRDVLMLEQVENSFQIGINPAKYKVKSI
jgi:hypothetical protein